MGKRKSDILENLKRINSVHSLTHTHAHKQDADQIMEALKSASAMLAELRTSSLTPVSWWEASEASILSASRERSEQQDRAGGGGWVVEILVSVCSERSDPKKMSSASKTSSRIGRVDDGWWKYHSLPSASGLEVAGDLRN